MSVTQLSAVDITVTKAQSKASRSFYLLVHASQCDRICLKEAYLVRAPFGRECCIEGKKKTRLVFHINRGD